MSFCFEMGNFSKVAGLSKERVAWIGIYVKYFVTGIALKFWLKVKNVLFTRCFLWKEAVFPMSFFGVRVSAKWIVLNLPNVADCMLRETTSFQMAKEVLRLKLTWQPHFSFNPILLTSQTHSVLTCDFFSKYHCVYDKKGNEKRNTDQLKGIT